MNNREVLRIAMAQSAIDANCNADDFCKNKNCIVISEAKANARKYLELPFSCDLVSYGNNIVASVDKDIIDIVRDYIDKYPVEHCFETPNMHVLNEALQGRDMRICFMAEYFLPDVEVLVPLSCAYEIRILKPKDFSNYYKPEWENALCEKNKQRDILAVGAFDNGELVGLAGASADCDTMWQIGIDVLPNYRKKGIAAALTSVLAYEILKEGIVPFYCAAWSNIGSVRNAIKAGFRPAWVQMTAKSIMFVSEMNK